MCLSRDSLPRLYDSIFFKLPWEESEKDKRIKAIACFFVAPDLRGEGKGMWMADDFNAPMEELAEYM